MNENFSIRRPKTTDFGTLVSPKINFSDYDTGLRVHNSNITPEHMKYANTNFLPVLCHPWHVAIACDPRRLTLEA